MSSQNYFNKVNKYDNKYNTLKKQIDDDEYNSCLNKLKKNLLLNPDNSFPKGKYTIHIKMLSDNNQYKICHHYSLFSLYNSKKFVDCCHIYSMDFMKLLKPQCTYKCDYKDSCVTNICDNTKVLDCESDCEQIKYNIRFYNLKKDNNSTEFFSHSSRLENGLWWHKFHDYNCLFAIEEEPDFFIYQISKEVTINSYKVPQSMFKDSTEKDIVVKLII